MDSYMAYFKRCFMVCWNMHDTHFQEIDKIWQTMLVVRPLDMGPHN